MRVVHTILVSAIRFYKIALSPLMPPRCRFVPSCSSYALEALQNHGVLKGLLLTVWRILRCHPWSEGGYDPVPPPTTLHHKRHH